MTLDTTAIKKAATRLNSAAAANEHGLTRDALNPFLQDSQQRSRVRAFISNMIHQEELGPEVIRGDLDKLVSLLVGMGPLDGLIQDPQVISIQVLGAKDVLVQRSGTWEKASDVNGQPVEWESEQHLRNMALALAARSGSTLDADNPTCQAFFSNPAGRLQIDSTARTQSGVTLHVRLGRSIPITLVQMLATGSISSEMYEFLQDVAQRDIGLLIVGLPGTGKTTFLEALMEFWPDLPAVGLDDRSEFHPRHSKTIVYDVPAEQLSRAFVDVLRKNVTRLAVAEVRGDEAAEMLRYSGALTIWTTLHGSTRNAMLRLMALVQGAPESPYANLASELVQRVIAHAFPIVVEMQKLQVGGRALFFVRNISQMTEEGIPSPIFEAQMSGPILNGFHKVGDPDKVLDTFPRQVWGNVALPQLDSIDTITKTSSALGLAAIGEYLRTHSGPAAIHLLKRMMQTNSTIKRTIDDGVTQQKKRIRQLVKQRAWGDLLQAYSDNAADPVLQTVAAEVTQFQSALWPIPVDEVRRRHRLSTAADEIMEMTQDYVPRHVLSLIGLLVAVQRDPDIYPADLKSRVEQRLQKLVPDSENLPLHLHLLRSEKDD